MDTGFYEVHLKIVGENPFQFLKDCEGRRAGYKVGTGSYRQPYPCAFTFNALVPVPQNVLEAGYTDMCLSDSLALDDPDYNKQLKVPNNGVDWQMKNWGVLWDLDGDEFTPDIAEWGYLFDNAGVTEINLEFSTVGGPPRQWLIHSARVYPHLEFKLTYFENEFNLAGRVNIEDGIVIGEVTYFKENDYFIAFMHEEFGDVVIEND